MLFGEFLIKKGKLKKDDMERVLQVQKKSVVPLGKLAMERNMLTLADIFTIRSQQRRAGSKFGEIAVRLNLLKPRQVDSLLEIQQQLKPYIGELLSSTNMISEADLLDLLMEFKSMYGRLSGGQLRQVGLTGLDPAMIIGIKNALSKAGYEVLSCAARKPDLRAMFLREPDFIVIGISPANPDLLSDLKDLRYEQPGARPRIMAIAEKLDEGDRAKAEAAGVTDIIPSRTAKESVAAYVQNLLENLYREKAGKVVLVDDSPTVLRLMSLFLERDGYESYLSSGGEEAQELVGKVQPDVVLMDIYMPDIDGIELCRRIKTNIKTRNIPVIMVSTAKSIARLKEALDSGASDYIIKPFQQEELLARVRSHIKTKRLIDEIQQSRRDLVHANEKLAEANERKTDFLATVAHDLRTPLTSVRTYAELLTMPKIAPDAQKEFIGVIINESLRMTSLIRNYLDVSRMESSAETRRRAEVNLTDMLAYFSNIYGTMARNKEVKFEAHIPKDAVYFMGDKERFEQVLANLLDNAVKYTPAGGSIKLGLNSAAMKRAGAAELTVADTGPGILPEAKQYLFKKFHQLPNESQPIKGTGLGLAICKEIVEWHGGKIDYDSTPGKGTTFKVVLPVVKPGKAR